MSPRLSPIKVRCQTCRYHGHGWVRAADRRIILRKPVLARVLGAFLLAYVGFLLVKGRFRLPETTATALLGGALYGLTAGIFGVGGAVRGAFLAAYDLPKEVYIFTAGAIGLVVDTGRLLTYWGQGALLDPRLLWGLLLFVPVSFAGARLGERMVARIPQERLRTVIAGFLPLIRQPLPDAGSAGRLEERWFRAAVVIAKAACPARAAMRPAGRRRPGGRDGLQEDAPWAATRSADE